MDQLEGARRRIYLGIILIAVGVVMNTSLHTPLGIVLLAIGGLLFIAGMNEKQKEDKKNRREADFFQEAPPMKR